ncbi:MAG: MFS transporter, partial [Rhodospirillales bacterium]|nr:MFS transporter [Rhodospirillales bacterium]
MTSAAAEQRVTQAAITPAAITPATWAVAATAGLSGLLIGYDTAVIAPALGFLTAEFGIGPAMQGIVVASVLLGGLVGSILAGAAARRWGRRPVLIATATLFLLAAPGAAMLPQPARTLGHQQQAGQHQRGGERGDQEHRPPVSGRR